MLFRIIIIFFSYHRLVNWSKGSIILPKFKLKSTKKHKFNLINDRDEIFNSNITGGVHIEIFSNKNAIIEGCKSIVDYEENYIKLKIKKGFLILSGTEFLISSFEEESIIIKGNISTIEFCI